ncbi:MAG: radical SAM protein, partial [Actinomycetales bacterium]
MTAPSPERSLDARTSTRVDVAIQGIRLLDAPVTRPNGAGPSADG